MAAYSPVCADTFGAAAAVDALGVVVFAVFAAVPLELQPASAVAAIARPATTDATLRPARWVPVMGVVLLVRSARGLRHSG
jgi:hypothetical protein